MNKNRLCLILPYAGKFHDYFQLFLHSVYKNKHILDLLILIPDSSTPELKTEVNFNLPANVFIKEVSFLEASKIFENKLSEIFECNIDLQNSKPLYENAHKHRTCIIKSPYNLCHYKLLFNIWCKDFLQEYSHWGWTDCDLILGNISKFYPNLFETDSITCAGHLGIFRNIELPLEAFRGEESWSKELYNKAYNYFVTQTACCNFAGDETWMILNLTRYQQIRNYKQTIRNLADYFMTPMWEQIDKKRNYDKFISGSGFGNTITKDQVIDLFQYENGELSCLFDREYYPLMYVHFMTRTNMSDNKVWIEDYESPLVYRVFPPLTFV